MGDIVFSINDALFVAKELGITFDKFMPRDLLNGMNIEIEHGKISNKTNVTNDDMILTAKIALAHLNEFPNYYNEEFGLKQFEKYLKYKLMLDKQNFNSK